MANGWVRMHRDARPKSGSLPKDEILVLQQRRGAGHGV
jgi:hypothetical protein